ncbi:CDP-glycerol glycerophosphotransferase, TagB/SpsB family [Kushneria avicenniae]|uniref:CDP-glycerol glycerophosphotransferase, TagB/SpsB family n=1 Tax=Kushneria avicenniae TaxID=402385 RepID=A0A1I1IHD4_9GAMM|nr:CDP-glycerol glycerophosphotransferase family protein [Kushneria avicenniae]SFC32640.1 CDP-glycerol glycerophosphotransferase, TagB/SpsB family [Kushneria avicenniae]
MDVASVKIENGSVFVTVASPSDDTRLLAMIRNGKKVTYFEKLSSDVTKTTFKLNANRVGKEGYYNLYFEKNDERVRAGKNLYQEISNNKDRFLGQTEFKAGRKTLFLNCYLTYPGTGLSLYVKKNKNYFNELIGINEPPRVISLSREKTRLNITGEGFFLGPIKSSEDVYVLASSRHLDKGKKISADVSYIKEKQGAFRFSSSVNIQNLFNEGFFENRFVDLFLVIIDEDGKPHKRRLTDRQNRLEYISGDDIFLYKKIAARKDFYPYLTRSIHRGVSIMYRDHRSADSTWCQLKEKCAVALDNLLPASRKSRWVLFEHESQTAQDNAFVFFKWLKENHPEQKSYYIIDKKAKDYNRVSGYDGVVSYFSFRHLMLMLRCSLIVSSQSRFHGYKFRPLKSPMREKIIEKKNVFLQHGVTGLKKNASFDRKHFRDAADLITVSSETELEIVRDNWNFEEGAIALSGMARFDNLVDKSSSNILQVLVIPTWRLWLEGTTKEEFKKSEFFEFYSSLLGEKNIKKTRDGKPIEFIFYLHSKIAEHLNAFKCADNVKCIEMGATPVNELMMQSNIMVTDYSSVAWDFLYMNKKVIFSHFDADRYLATHGSYMDFSNELFGRQVFSVDELNKAVLDNGNEKNFDAGENFFEYQDRKNCERIYDSIKNSFPCS